MPIYEYQCKACGHEFEALQKMSDAPLCDCPVCQKPELQKKISAAAFHLKGTGWYVTDFKGDKSAKSDAKSDSAQSSDKAENKPTQSDSSKETSSQSKDSGSTKVSDSKDT